MPSGRSGSIHIFRFAGVDVFLHWSWFFVALFEINSRGGHYTSLLWNVLEYLALFVIVLMHEYGHALACRKVGGVADHIVLWPLGGVAYVDAPQRPGATLWSIAAGPLVNVALAPLLFGGVTLAAVYGWEVTNPNLYQLIFAIFVINMGLLIFNMLPIYPLDGGQILRSLLWYPLGRARSLTIATVVGFIGVAALAIYAFRAGSTWIFILGIFMVMNCWSGFKHSMLLHRLSKIPRRTGFACPWCKSEPPLGPVWACGQCRTRFDTFVTGGICPNCGKEALGTQCLDCRHSTPIKEWGPSVVAQNA